MHAEARTFLDYCQAQFPEWFTGAGNVLDVGSVDINGTNRHYFEECRYTGCDVAPGPNVDIVSPCHLLPHAPSTFTTIISSECFEHDMHYARSFSKIVELLKPGGLFVFTCASVGRPEHGTRRTSCWDSLTGSLECDPAWCDYYQNLTSEHVRLAIPVPETFGYHRFYYNASSKDLYFVGIKRAESDSDSGTTRSSIPDFEAPGVTRITY